MVTAYRKSEENLESGACKVYTYRQMKNLFLQQSYNDSWEDYERSLNKSSYIKWDYIILTSSNEEQAQTYREQIEFRLKNGLLPDSEHYAVLPDPDGKRVGSGGATFNVLRYIAEREQKAGCGENPFKDRRILVIHSGGDSKRVPQYSAIGKLFSPVPRELPDGRGSTLFDEFMIGMSGVPSRIKEGMLVLSGDVLLLFNPLQIDALFDGAAAISIKENVETGKDHGVFLNDGNDYVGQFLHKQSEEHLREVGAVNDQGCVDLDTGAVLFDCNLMMSLFSLISTDGKTDKEKFDTFVSEEARISFYGDFLYPLAKDSTLESYYEQAAEGVINNTLTACRTKIWDVVHDYSMKLICLSPAEFIHFGTTRELRQLVTSDVNDYGFLSWSKKVLSTGAEENDSFAAHNAYIGHAAVIGDNCYIENSYVLGESVIGSGAVVSNLHLRNCRVPENTVWHGLTLKNGKYVIRVYGVQDNPKDRLKNGGRFSGISIAEFMEKNGLEYSQLWDDDEDYLWFAKLYPVCDTREQAAEMAEIICRMTDGTASENDINAWKNSERESLYLSFNSADVLKDLAFEHELESRILANRFTRKLSDNVYYEDALKVFGRRGITEDICSELMADAENSSEDLKIRIYYALSRFMKKNKIKFDGKPYDYFESKCFNEILELIYNDAVKNLPDSDNYRITTDEVNVQLPVRVNWGGGWTDTPPHCNEKGGVVLNTAIKLKGIYPVQVCVKKLDKLYIEFESQDVGVKGSAETVAEIQDCYNPYDPFALHKAALIACGIVPQKGSAELKDILKRIGGGIYISTQVVGVPKGSGLGTSSILSAACVKALMTFLGQDTDNSRISEIVLGMEQIMSTGGGWQDQVGGLTTGIKFIRSKPGVHQSLDVEHIKLSEETQKELQDRFALIYTGQRRLARNLLRDVVGNYIGARPESVSALDKMASLAALMKFELERGNVDAFAKLLDQHWELSKQLDAGSTNTCIDQIFMSCDDLICGKIISGAGGGGFLQVILKKGVTKQQLRERIKELFQDSGVDVWDCDLLF